MSATTSAAIFVGRIGGLAIALGVGAAIASGTGAAWADTSDSGTSSRSTGSSSSAASKATKSTKDPAASDRPSKRSRDESPDRDSSPTRNTGGSRESDKAQDTDKETAKDAEPAAKRQSTLSVQRQERSTAARVSAPAQSDAATAPAPEAPQVSDTKPAGTPTKPIPVETAAPPAVTAVTAALTKAGSSPTAAAPTALVPRSAAAATAAPPRIVTRVLSALGFTPSAVNSPAAPAQSPALLALLGWVRREVDRNAIRANPTSPAAATYAAAAVVDPLPSSLPSKRIGWVTGPGITNTPGGFNIYGTDLGIMWDGGTIDGQRFVHVAFGDTFSGPRMQGGWRNNVLLISYDNRLGNGLTLAPTGPAYQFIRARQALSFFGSEVTVIPTAGIHIDGRQYVNYMSVKSWDTPGRWTTNFSAISRFNPTNDTWELVPSTIRSAGWLRSSTPYVAGSQNFQQMAYVLQPEDQVAEGEDRYLYAFGTPSGRAGSAHLSRVAEGDVTDLSKYEYWDGKKWVVGNAAVAAPIIGDSTKSAGLFGFVVDWANDPKVFGGYLGGLFGAKTGGNVSEMSVQYNEYLGKYVVLYGDGKNNMKMRVADTPEGQWSDPITVATARDYPGLYAPMIHPWSGTGELQGTNGAADYNNLYWNMSIWGDYNVVLMQTDLSPLKTVQV